MHLLPFLPVLLAVVPLIAATDTLLTKKHPLLGHISLSDPLDSSPLLFARDCTIHSTCAECFGEGSRICATHYCYTPGPGHGEQCCTDGAICISKTNKCCDDSGGPGISGPPGIPIPLTSLQPTPTGTSAPVSVTCTPDESYDACCQRVDPTWHFCPGAVPARGCYSLLSQTCCTDGTVCEGEGCCDVVSAKPTAPYTLDSSTHKSSSTATDQGTSGSMTTQGTAPTTAGSGATTDAGASTPTDAGATGVSTSTPTGAAVTNALGGAVAVAVGVLGVAML